MSETNPQKLAVGVVLLAVSSVLILGTGVGLLDSIVPLALIGVATLAMAAGAVLVGTAGSSGRPV